MRLERTCEESVLEYEVEAGAAEPKAEYLPPMLVDYGLLAKEAASAGDPGGDGSASYS